MAVMRTIVYIFLNNLSWGINVAGGYNLQDLTVIVSTLLPVVCFNSESNERSGFSAGLKVTFIMQ